MFVKKFLPFVFSLVFLGCATHSVKKAPEVPAPPPAAEPVKSTVKHVSGTGWELDIPEKFNVLPTNPNSGRELASGSPELDQFVFVYLDTLDEGGLPAYVLGSLHDIQESEQIPLAADKVQWHDKETAHMVWVDPKDASFSEGWITTHNNKIVILLCVRMEPKEKSDFCSTVASTMKFK